MLTEFDFFPKLHEDIKVKTLSGGAVSIVSSLCILMLFFSELSRFLTVEKTDHVYVDTYRDEELHINFDITMHRLPCNLVSIDAKDGFGEHQTNVLHHVHKHALDEKGEPIGEDPVEIELKQTLGTSDLKALGDMKKKADSNPTPTSPPSPSDKCLSCFGAEKYPGMCCNTCEDLRSAYTGRGWAMDSIWETDQCKGQKGKPMRYKELEDHQGCRLTGYLNVSKVAGNFHISPGKTHEVNAIHIYDLGAFSDGKFNISHTIHTLSFGQQYPGLRNPLDKKTKLFGPEVTIGMHQYYIKVVPTRYNYLNGKIVETNQFSVTDHLRILPNIQTLKPGNLPGVFVHYDFSPMRVEITESREPLSHFLTQLCAILGGVFTVAGIIDQMVYQSMKQIQKKVQLGKFS
ncbi:hypothetical protein AAMO2058_000944700 [Amorphochlora amoebiformis]